MNLLFQVGLVSLVWLGVILACVLTAYVLAGRGGLTRVSDGRKVGAVGAGAPSHFDPHQASDASPTHAPAPTLTSEVSVIQASST